MSESRAPRARRRAVPVEELVPDGGRPDYADAFEIRLIEPDGRSPEQWARCALEHAPRSVRRVVLIAQRGLLRLKLEPQPSRDHIFGWKIRLSTPAVVQLEASSPLMRGVIVVRKLDPTCVVVTTLVFYTRRASARVVWATVAPLHRAVARFVLAGAARPADHACDTTSGEVHRRS